MATHMQFDTRDWVAFLAACNWYITMLLSKLFGAFAMTLSGVHTVEQILQHIPVWTSALTGLAGLLILLARNWDLIQRAGRSVRSAYQRRLPPPRQKLK